MIYPVLAHIKTEHLRYDLKFVLGFQPTPTENIGTLKIRFFASNPFRWGSFHFFLTLKIMMCNLSITLP